MAKSSKAQTLHVVVSCKSRKTVDIPRALRISTVRAHRLEDRVREWISALQQEASDTWPAADLYAGDHWKIVLRVPSAAPDLNVKLWVASAGYGLVPIDYKLKPYSATFVRPHEESITTSESQFSSMEWWQAISNWEVTGEARTVTKLAQTVARDGGFLLLALSAPYSLALANDIASAAAIAPGRIGLISAGVAGETPASLKDVILPAEARLKTIVGGAMQGINARIAHKVVADAKAWYPNLPRLRTLIESWVSTTDPLPKYSRDRMGDDAVRSFIRRGVRGAGSTSKSALLRELRDAGLACEQARFGRLYKEEAEASVLAEAGTL